MMVTHQVNRWMLILTRDEYRWRGLTSLIVLASTVSLILSMGCVEEEAVITPTDDHEMPERGFFMGVLPMPNQDQTLDDAYKEAAETCEFVPVWGRPTRFYDLAKDLSGNYGRTFIDGLIRGNGMFPLVHMSFIDKSDGKLIVKAPPGMGDVTLSDSEWRNSYISAAEDVARTAKPLYISLGNEVNRWYEAYGMSEDDPNGFQHFVSLYEEAYDVVKAISPEAKVFCVFSREIVDENRKADLSVLKFFDSDRLDLLVFTSYAYAVQGINGPEDIPDDYFSSAFEHIPPRPIGFSELGWLVHSAFGGERGQADFLRDVATRLTIDQGLDLEFLAWGWLHDLEGGDTTGLVFRNGTAKMAYQVWKELSAKEE